jgi:hypothetical protein
VIRLLEVHQESIYCQNGKLLVLLSIVDEIQINHFLGYNIICSGGFDHLRIEPGDVDAQGHVSDDLLDDILLFGGVFVDVDGSKKLLKLIYFSFFVIYEKLRWWQRGGWWS